MAGLVFYNIKFSQRKNYLVIDRSNAAHYRFISVQPLQAKKINGRRAFLRVPIKENFVYDDY